jgi:hypothetical protein
MANKKQQLDTPALPVLGLSDVVYSQSVQNQNNGILRLFFTKLVNVIGSLIGPRGVKYLNAPYGAFQDGTDQIAANTTTAYPITFDTTDFSNGVTLSNSSRLNVTDSGIYNIQFSLQLANDTNTSQDIDIWFRKNGTNIDKSNSRYGLAPRKSAGDPYHVISALNFFVELNANDYVEIVWRTSDVGAYIEHYVASSTPTRPSIPSAIATMSFVSNLPN